MDSPYSVYHQTLCTCCDIISRLANDMHSLLQDMEVLLEQQIVHQSLQTQYNQLLLELQEKMGIINANRFKSDEDDVRLGDFEMFVKGIWKKINKCLDSERKKETFLSAKRGIPIAVIADQLLDFCFHCSYTYKNIFLHPHCCDQFNIIYSQLSNVVFPEVQYSDDFEQSKIFVKAATPCLKYLLKLVHIFISSEKMITVDSLCKAVIVLEKQNAQPPKRIIHLLDCIDLLSTSFDEGIPKLKSLLVHTDDMANHILKICAFPKKPPAKQGRVAGILNSIYMDCTHPANMSPKMFHIQLNNSSHLIPFKCEGQRIVGAARRRRRFPEDLPSTIKVPRLHIQPFPY